RLTGAGVDANNEKRYYVNGILAEGNATFDGITRFYKEGIAVNNWHFHQTPIDGYYYLFYKDGVRLTGHGSDGDGEHLFINGILAQGYTFYEGTYKYYKDGKAIDINSDKYYVNGIIANGWVFHKEPVDGYYYLFYKDGVRLTGAGVDANNETRYYVNGILAQGLQTVSGEPRVYRDGLFANGWVNGIYALNGYYANGWVQMENGEEEYFEYGKSASPKTLRENYTNEEFIQVMAYYIRKYSAQYGIKVNSGILAQAILESNWGRSVLSAKYHNYFGLKAGPYWTGKSVNMATQEEYVPGTYTNIRDNFRAFNSLEEGVRGYFEFTKFPNYAKIKTATTPEEYLTYIKQAGYATSSTYVQNTMRVVQTYNLTKYD
ncbi:MAG: glucosaminidase domain-containing protein, partial [Solobacterium sp.]|nr:glucosaminidase domain-containing protein [Solobacterium sp.]